ncbi:MAG: ATP-binding protein [Microbacteriaceae bacterium]|nr:MAG: ATP-binding protein [Microbacteriaceae bacterium]
MSLGLPGHLARKANSRALAGATRVGGLAALGFAAVCTIVQGAPKPNSTASDPLIPTIGFLAIAVLAAMFVVLIRHHSTPFMIATLVVGAVSTFLYTLAVLIENALFPGTELFVFTLPVVALALIGGTGSGSLTGVVWATLGYGVGEAAVFVAAVVTDRSFQLGPAALWAYLAVVAVLTLDGLTRNLQRGVQANILWELRVEQAIAVRKTVAADAAADLHDTVLSQLTVLAHAQPGPLTPRMRERIEDSLASWGRDRAAELERDAALARTVDDAWIQGGLASAVEQARDQGLSVTVSGDRAAFTRLNIERRRAVVLAVRQCFANVLLHSGQSAAELTLAAAPHEVSFMVVDAGRGFDESQTPPDRMGLRRSIRERIERVGGRVTVFSRPGAGTSIALVVPASASATDTVAAATDAAASATDVAAARVDAVESPTAATEPTPDGSTS